jgi:L-ascorbate metabolism protein UlaG (beta-lactamase superfamily)
LICPIKFIYSFKLQLHRKIAYTVGIMVITHHGGQCFKVSFGDTTLAFDPIAKNSKLASTKFGADVAFVSLNHPNFNGVDQAAHGSKEPYVVQGPGEYEIGDVTARGYGVKTTYEGVERYNSIYQVRLEEMNMIFLGALSSAEIDPKILGEFGEIDILFLPIGGGDVMDVPAAAKLAVKLEAKLIIPMHYDKTSLGAFLKEIGAEGAEQTDKLTIKKKDVNEMEGEVKVIKDA